MECSHCGYLLDFFPCSECGGEIPAKSSYCCWCGNPIKVERRETDLSERKLCRDGNCVGTINEKGVCNMCEKPYHEESS